jgi:hypothetical protein
LPQGIEGAHATDIFATPSRLTHKNIQSAYISFSQCFMMGNTNDGSTKSRPVFSYDHIVVVPPTSEIQEKLKIADIARKGYLACSGYITIADTVTTTAAKALSVTCLLATVMNCIGTDSFQTASKYRLHIPPRAVSFLAYLAIPFIAASLSIDFDKPRQKCLDAGADYNVLSKQLKSLGDMNNSSAQIKTYREYLSYKDEVDSRTDPDLIHRWVKYLVDSEKGKQLKRGSESSDE